MSIKHIILFIYIPVLLMPLFADANTFFKVSVEASANCISNKNKIMCFINLFLFLYIVLAIVLVNRP